MECSFQIVSYPTHRHSSSFCCGIHALFKATNDWLQMMESGTEAGAEPFVPSQALMEMLQLGTDTDYCKNNGNIKAQACDSYSACFEES